MPRGGKHISLISVDAIWDRFSFNMPFQLGHPNPPKAIKTRCQEALVQVTHVVVTVDDERSAGASSGREHARDERERWGVTYGQTVV